MLTSNMEASVTMENSVIVETKPVVTEDVEEFKQRIHQLEIKLAAAEQKSATTELYYKEELESQMKTIARMEKEKAELAAEIKLGKKQYEEKSDEVDDLKAMLEETQRNYEKQLRLTSKTDLTPKESPQSSKELESLKEANSDLKVQIKNLETTILTQTNTIQGQDNKIKALNGYISELKESLELKTSDIKELKEKISAQEELWSEKMAMANNENMNSLDDNRRGNSLFSELESRRVKVEEEMKRLRERVKSLTTENLSLQAKISKGDQQTGVILTQLQAVQKSQDLVIAEISKWKGETLKKFDMYTLRIEKLRDEYQNKLQRYATNSVVQDLKVCQERDQLLVQNISLQKEILDLKREIKINQHWRVESDAKRIIESVRSNGNDSKSNPVDTSCINEESKPQNCQQQ